LGLGGDKPLQDRDHAVRLTVEESGVDLAKLFTSASTRHTALGFAVVVASYSCIHIPRPLRVQGASR
jgi:hypothetical protein